MSIERQAEQWPHRTAGMRRGASDVKSFPSSWPFNFGDKYYRGYNGVTDPRWPGSSPRVYDFSPTGFNPRPESLARPDLNWQSAEPEQDLLPMDFPTETTIGGGYKSEMTEDSLPYDRKPQKLYRGLTVDLADPRAGHIRRMLHGEEHEDWAGDRGFNPLPGMPEVEDLTDNWYAHDYQNPLLGPALLDHLENHYDDLGLGRHWSLYPYTAKEFGGDGNSRMAVPLNVVLSAEWRGGGEDSYRRGTGGDWRDEGEITLKPDAPLHITNVHIQHPETKKWNSVLDTPQHRKAMALGTPGETDDDGERVSYPDLGWVPMTDKTNPNPEYLHRGVRIKGPVTSQALQQLLRNGLGRHWTADPQNAAAFGDPANHDESHDYPGADLYPGPRDHGLIFTIRHPGADAVDTDYSNTFDDEYEHTLHRGTPITVTDIHVKYPGGDLFDPPGHSEKWHQLGPLRGRGHRT